MKGVYLMPYLLIFFMLSSCGYKAQLRKGNLQPVAEVEEISFDFQDNLIFLEVFINGHKKRFILDSGAPNVIDFHIQEEFDLKPVFETGFYDAASRSVNLEMVKIDHIKFGSIEVENTVAAVADFSKFTCLNIDGIIGTNIMSLFDWKIDYQKEKAQLFKSGIPLDSLEGFGSGIPFFTSSQKSPFIKMTVGNTTFNKVEIDLGSNGGIGVQRWKQFTADNFESDSWVYGETSVGIHGPILDTTVLVIANDMYFGTFPVPTSKMTVKPSSTSKIGNRFLKNYQLILSWKNEAMYLKNTQIPITELDKNVVYLGWKEGEVYIKGYSKESEFSEKKIEIGDRVLRVYNLDVCYIDQFNFCLLKDYWKEKVLLQIEKSEGQEVIELVVDHIR